MATYAAFLRGVNVGRRTVKKDELIAAFSSMGANSVQTILASGNVLFQSSTPPVVSDLEGGLAHRFGFEIGIVLRSMLEIKTLIDADPFAACKGKSDVKLYVGMASGPIGDRLDGIKSVAGDFDLVGISNCDYFAVAFKQQGGRFGAGLDALEKRFKDLLITTRNWNTLLRIAKKAAQGA